MIKKIQAGEMKADSGFGAATSEILSVDFIETSGYDCLTISPSTNREFLWRRLFQENIRHRAVLQGAR
jgi:hypothetical protein